MPAEPTAPANEAPPARAITPTKAFAITAALLTLAGGALYLMQDNEPKRSTAATRPSPLPTRPSQSAPSIAEAKGLFAQLNDLRLDAYEDPKSADLHVFLTSDSPLRRIGEQEFERLRRQEIHVFTKTRSNRISNVQVGTDEIVLQQTFERRILFEGPRGEDLTRKPGWERRAIRWTLRLDAGTWKIFDSELLSSEKLS